MTDTNLTIVLIIVALIIYAIKAKPIKPHVILGVLKAITLQSTLRFYPLCKKQGLFLILTALIGVYDLTYVQKVKGAWRYFWLQ